MGRPRRDYVTGRIYHVIARGNNRERIFFEPEDQRRFLALLDGALERHGQLLHAYCLMSTHVHLVVQMGSVAISSLALDACGRYSRWLNWKRGRSGHLFERRHRAVAVDSDRQLLQLLRYVHRNPVEAGIVGHPGAHRWSSHAAYAGDGRSTPIRVVTRLGLRLLHPETARARQLYLRLTAAPDRETIEDLLPGEEQRTFIAASERRVRSRERRAAASGAPPRLGIESVLAAVASSTGVSPDRMAGGDRDRDVTEARALAAAVVTSLPTLTVAGLARRLQRDPTTLREAAARLGARSGSALPQQILDRLGALVG